MATVRLQLQPITQEGDPAADPVTTRGEFTLTGLTLDQEDQRKEPEARKKWKFRSTAGDAPTRRMEEFLIIRALRKAEESSPYFTVSLSAGAQIGKCRRLDDSLIIYEL